jgi:hypothetical protein
MLSRQVRLLCDFPSQRTTDRRLKFLIDSGYVERKHILYGIPALYYPTHKGKKLIGTSGRIDKIKIDQITHDIAVVDTVIRYHLERGVELASITSEKELHKRSGFGTRQHQPDFIYKDCNGTYCFEIELTPKSKDRMLKIMSDNFMAYDKQMWIVPKGQTKIRKVLKDNETAYPNIEVLALEIMTDFVKQAGGKSENEQS